MRRSNRIKVCLFLMLFLAIFSLSGSDEKLQFSAEEARFLAAHPTIRIGIDPKFVPFEFISNEGKHGGITADVLSLVAERTGLTFIYDPSLSWTQTVQKTRERSIDLLAAVGYTQARAQYMTYLEPYLQFQRAIIVQKSNTSISSFEDLKHRQVAVQRDSSHEGFLLYYPEIIMRQYDTVEEALLAVNRGEEVAFVGNEATSIYLSRTLGLTELQFVPIAEGGLQDLHMAVRSDWPQLATILQKTLDSISEEEMARILDRWIRYESRTDLAPIIRLVGIIVSILVIIIGSSLFWVSRLREAVKEKDAAQKQAQQADLEKSRFLARVSHEIRTPLNGIRGMSYLLEKTSLEAAQLRYVKAISGATQTMQSIINDILEFSRLDEDRIILEHIPFTLDDVLENCISIESYLIHQKGLLFRLHQAEGVPQHLMGDPTRLSQILINLLNNAVKFTENGSIELSVEAQEMQDQACVLRFEVKDSGIGMDARQLENLFKPFVQANASIHRKYGGSGLGLSIVKALVEKMDGKLSVTSELGKGSCFTAVIPYTLDARGSEEEQSRRRSIDFSAIKALVVCSDRYLDDRIRSLFYEYKIQGESVSSPSLAAKLLESGNYFDLVVVEISDSLTFSDSLAGIMEKQAHKRPKVLALVHDDSKQKSSAFIDVVLPLPLINSVLFNALLHLFGRGEGEAQESDLSKQTAAALPLQILVVEDNATNQIIAKEILQRQGWSVHLADNGKIGYEKFLALEGVLDVVLMDLHMDVMDGYESSTLIRSKNETIPIIITSADLMETVRKRCMQIGVNDLVGKPYDPDQLIEKVAKLGIPYHQSRRSIDFERGVFSIGGDKQLYLRVLFAFTAELEQLIPSIKKAIEEQNLHTAAELAHKAKGSTGSIGALEAQKLCANLQQTLQNGRMPPEEALLTVYIELEKVLLEAKEYVSKA